MGIDSHGNNGHSHSHTGCFPFLPIHIPNFVTNSHYHGNTMGFPFPLGIPFPWSSLVHTIVWTCAELIWIWCYFRHASRAAHAATVITNDARILLTRRQSAAELDDRGRHVHSHLRRTTSARRRPNSGVSSSLTALRQIMRLSILRILPFP